MNKSDDHKEWVREKLLPIYFTFGTIGRDALFDIIKEKDEYDGISRRDVAFFLKNLETHQLHLVRPRQRSILKINATRILQKVQIDLMDMQKLSRANSRYTFLMNIIDVYSRYMWVYPLKNKEMDTVQESFNEWIQDVGVVPVITLSDRGNEFNSMTDDYPRVKHVRSPAYSPESQGIVERSNLTLKRAIFGYMTQENKRRYIDVLPELVESYNNRPHNSLEWEDKLYSPTEIYIGVVPDFRHDPRGSEPKKFWPNILNRGDKVRISLVKSKDWSINTFTRRQYTPRWTRELYTIKGRSRNEPYVYSLMEPTEKRRYLRQDLLYVDEDWLIEVNDNHQEINWIEPDEIEPVEAVATRRERRNVGRPARMRDHYEL